MKEKDTKNTRVIPDGFKPVEGVPGLYSGKTIEAYDTKHAPDELVERVLENLSPLSRAFVRMKLNNSQSKK